MTKIKCIKIGIALLLLVYSFNLSAQQQLNNSGSINNASIKLLAKGYGDSVVLRWAPSTAISWDYLNKTGYSIIRLDVTDEANPKQSLLTIEPIKPLSLEEMKRRLDRNNTMAAVAAQSLYGTTFTPSSRQGFAGSIADQGDLFRNRYSYVLLAADFDAPTAQAIGLRFVDKNVTKGSVYAYKIMAAIAPKDFTIDSAVALVTNNRITNNESPSGIVALATDRQSELQWNRNQEEKFSGFYIERSSDGTNFQPVNKFPFYSSIPDSTTAKDSLMARFRDVLENSHVFIDSLPQNYKNYYYRVRGINPFAELSAYSETVVVAGRDMIPPVPPGMLPVELLGGKKVKLNWRKAAMENDLKGYFINKSKNVDGPFELVSSTMLSKNQTSFIDTGAYKHGATFYVIVAVDTANNSSTSLPVMAVLPDNTAPAPPIGLKGKIDKDGYVYLSWDTNKEEDFRTYKVYVANNPTHIFAQITVEDLNDTTFVDSITLKTLSKDIYYRIAAADYNNNHSEFSEILTLRKPDIIPPVAPVFDNIKVSDNGVEINVIQSSSSDAIRYTIFRKEETTSWKPVAAVNHDKTKASFLYSDTSIQPGIKYYYSAETIDEDSLHSEMSTAYQIKNGNIPLQPAINTLKAVYDEKSKTVKLNWNYTQSGNYFFVLYRAAANKPLETFRSFDKEEQVFMDGEFADNVSKYQYAIKAVFKDGRQDTKLSIPVSVQLKTQ